ncbi:hypothetical protein CSUI_007852 [Cystoisospora suis]|uniref:Uncharacterized protein n=1 Tax=Cystoisospora suis TaxID=483139 RepID=A0A2C6KPB7_9APIC|nr:hypothetical protein CSUI_007852 [Cystoisospora suis]
MHAAREPRRRLQLPVIQNNGKSRCALFNRPLYKFCCSNRPTHRPTPKQMDSERHRTRLLCGGLTNNPAALLAGVGHSQKRCIVDQKTVRNSYGQRGNGAPFRSQV